MMQLRHQMEDLQQRNWILRFNYSNPEANFDRSKVFGRILQLVEIQDPRFLQAIEHVAGGRLANIVVIITNISRWTTNSLLNCFSRIRHLEAKMSLFCRIIRHSLRILMNMLLGGLKILPGLSGAKLFLPLS